MWSSAVLLSACSSAEPVPVATPTPQPISATATPTVAPTPTPEAPAATVSIWLSWPPDDIRQLNELIEAYQQRNPGTEFSVAYVPADELRQTVEAAFQAGDPPSIFLGPSEWGPELMQAGMVVDLAQLPVAQLESVVQPLAWSQVEFGRRTLGLPIQLRGTVLYRNRELAAVPAATVESLVDASQAYRGTLNVGISLDYGFATVAPFALACGGPLVEQSEPLDLGGPVLPCWLELLRELSVAGPVDFNTDDGGSRFAEGSSAWQIDSTERYEQFSAALGAQTLVVDPWPVFESTGEPIAGYVWTENLYFSSGIGAGELEQAWAFATSLLSADTQLALSNPNRAANIPIHAAVPPPPGYLGQMHQALLGGSALPLWTVPEEQLGILERAARAVSLQGADVETALRRALEELAEATEEPAEDG